MGYLTLYTSDPVTELPSRHDDDDPVRNKVPQARSGDDLTACVFPPPTVIAFQLMPKLVESMRVASCCAPPARE